MTSKWGEGLRILAIVAMGLTALFTLLGGAGTACIAYSADQYGARFAVYVPSMPLYQVFFYVGIFAGVAGMVATYALLRGDKWAYKGSLIILGIGAVKAIAQCYHSSWLREVPIYDTMPSFMVFLCTIITIVLFIVLKLPSIRKRINVDFTKPWRGKGSKAAGGGLTAIVAGIATITTPIWVGASHMSDDGYNLVNVYRTPLMLGGVFLLLIGTTLLVPVVFEMSRKQVVRGLYRKLRYAGQAHNI